MGWSFYVVPDLSYFAPDCWFDLLQDLLTMIIEELVDGVGQQLILPVKQVVHVDYHLEVNSILKLSKSRNYLPNLEVKVGVNNLQHLDVLVCFFKSLFLNNCNFCFTCFPSASSTGTILENPSAVTSIIFVVKEPEPWREK